MANFQSDRLIGERGAHRVLNRTKYVSGNRFLFDCHPFMAISKGTSPKDERLVHRNI